MAAPYSLDLDPSVAQQLADQGGTLLVLDLPEGSYFGIDHMVGLSIASPSPSTSFPFTTTLICPTCDTPAHAP